MISELKVWPLLLENGTPTSSSEIIVIVVRVQYDDTALMSSLAVGRKLKIEDNA